MGFLVGITYVAPSSFVNNPTNSGVSSSNRNACCGAECVKRMGWVDWVDILIVLYTLLLYDMFSEERVGERVCVYMCVNVVEKCHGDEVEINQRRKHSTRCATARVSRARATA